MYNDPLVKVISIFSKLLGLKVTDVSVGNYVLSHPNYPSLLTISDFLSKWSIPNASFKFSEKGVDKLPKPFIAYVGNEFTVVSEVTGDKISYYDSKGKYHDELKDDFLSRWNGISLLAEPSNIKESNYDVKKFIGALSLVRLPALISVLLIICGIRIFFFTGDNNFIFSTLLGLKLFGVLISLLLLWMEIDKYNPAIPKICNGAGPKVNCDAILNSKYSKIFPWLSLSEVGFFYFMGTFIALVIDDKFMPYMTLMNIAALPAIPLSLGYQGIVVKKWCLYCVSIQLTLLFEFLLAYADDFSTLRGFHTSVQDIVSLFFFFLLPIAIWYIYKYYVDVSRDYKDAKFELKRLKSNIDVFNLFAKSEKKFSIYPEGLGITLGNWNSPKKLIKVCNPYCTPCSKAHPEIVSLLENNFEVKIIYDIGPNDYDTFIPARHLLAIYARGDEAYTLEALGNWYIYGDKNYQNFAEKYPITAQELLNQDEMIAAMRRWCSDNNITFTPTYYFNGSRLPFSYGLKNVNDLVV